jgi:hypothetical protein
MTLNNENNIYKIIITIIHLNNNFNNETINNNLIIVIIINLQMYLKLNIHFGKKQYVTLRLNVLNKIFKCSSNERIETILVFIKREKKQV